MIAGSPTSTRVPLVWRYASVKYGDLSGRIQVTKESTYADRSEHEESTFLFEAWSMHLGIFRRAC